MRARSYVLTMGLVSALTVGATVLVNAAVDPLWYFGGNRLADRNFPFNEREAVLNHFIGHRVEFDCAVFGSSRTTLFDAAEIRAARCVNLAFSDGKAVEFVHYARYLKATGFRPTRLIVGADVMNFFDTIGPPVLPPYVEAGHPPPPAWQRYATLSVLKMSLNTLADRAPLPRYYDAALAGRIRAGTPMLADRPGDPQIAARIRGTYSADTRAVYEQLLSVFADANAALYIPPISIWHLRDARDQGLLEDYVRGVHALGRLGAVLYDFSVPSVTTSRRDNTYDGSHYDAEANAFIAAVLDGREDGQRFVVNGLDFGTLLGRYRTALDSPEPAWR